MTEGAEKQNGPGLFAWDRLRRFFRFEVLYRGDTSRAAIDPAGYQFSRCRDDKRRRLPATGVATTCASGLKEHPVPPTISLR